MDICITSDFVFGPISMNGYTDYGQVIKSYLTICILVDSFTVIC